MAARPVATDQAFPSICPLGELGMCGDWGVKRERRWGSPRLPPSWGKGRRGWTSKGGQANFPPTGQVAFVRTGPTQSGQWGIMFTFRPTGVTTEPRRSLLHDKGGAYKGGQAAPH